MAAVHPSLKLVLWRASVLGSLTGKNEAFLLFCLDIFSGIELTARARELTRGR